MLFSHDTEVSLAEAAALVNTVGLDGDTLVTLADLDDFLAHHPYSGVDSPDPGRARIRTRTAAATTQILDSQGS